MAFKLKNRFYKQLYIEYGFTTIREKEKTNHNMLCVLKFCQINL